MILRPSRYVFIIQNIMKKSKKWKVLSSALVFVMILQIGIGLPNINAETVGNLTVMGGTKDTDYSYVNNVLTVKTNTSLTISGNTTTDTIVVDSTATAAKITLNGANVDASSNANKAAIETKSGSNTTITLEGKNILKGGSSKAGFAVDASSIVTIQGEGSIEVTGGAQAAGIGANKNGNTGTIKITSGTVKATATAATTESDPNGAGIGGAASNGKKSTGVVYISGGTVEATGAKRGAGIGQGGSNLATDSDDSDTSTFLTTISGGTVVATGGDSGAGIGAGYRGGKVTTSISGGTVTAIGGSHGAGIGGGNAANNVTTNITGGQITATAGQKNGAGIGGGYDGDNIATVISGGVVTANGSTNGGSGIGLGTKSVEGDDVRTNSFTTTNVGNAFILASSIQDVSKKAEWKGLIFDGSIGAIYGKTYTLAANITIPENHTLNITTDDKLTIPKDITLTNSGTISNAGKIIKNGILAGTPATGDGAQTADSSVVVTFSKNVISYGENAIITATISPKITEANKGTVKFYLGDATSGKLLNAEPIAVTNQKAILEMSGIVWQTEGADWTKNKITAVFSGTTGLETSFGIGSFTFEKADNNPVVTIADFMFGKTPSTPVVNGNLTGIKPIYKYKVKDTSDDTYTSEMPKNAGAYTVQASFAPDQHHNAVKVTADFNITKAIIAAPTGLTAINESIFGKSDGTITGLTTAMEYSTTMNGVYTAVTKSDMNFAAGTYFIRMKEDANHSASKAMEVIAAGKKLTISIPEAQVGYTASVDKTAIGWHDSFTITYKLKDGYNEGSNFAIKVNGNPITGKNGTYTVANNEQNAVITVEGVSDATAPTGTITLKENSWNQVLNTITFGKFFKETETVSISGTDAGSGINKIYYYVASDSVNPTTLKDSDWKEFTKLSISPNTKAVIYAKITDHAGNTTYISSDGLVFYSDSTITPAITKVDLDMLKDITVDIASNGNTLKEIKNGTTTLTSGVDYTMKDSMVTIKKAYLAKTKTDNKDVTLSFVFNPMGIETTAITSTATLTISDKATITPTVTLQDWKFGETPTVSDVKGNIGNAAVTFYYKTKGAEDSTYTKTIPTAVGNYTVKAMIAATPDYKQGDATADFAITKASQLAPNVIGMPESISGRMDGKIDGLTTSMEYSTTKDGVYTAVTNPKMTLAAGTYYVRYATNDSYMVSPATPVEIKAGRKLKVNIPASQNGYTLRLDKTELNWKDNVTLTYNLKAGYYEGADFAIMINGKAIALADGKYVMKNNESDVTITVTGVHKNIVYTYNVMSGENSQWAQDDNKALTFRVDGDFTKFTDIKIDGNIVNSKNYDAKHGSTIIMLKADYLKTLSTGEHKLDIMFKDNKTVSAHFTIKKPNTGKPSKLASNQEITKTPQTGDSSNTMSWFLLFLASTALIALAATQRIIQKRK